MKPHSLEEVLEVMKRVAGLRAVAKEAETRLKGVEHSLVLQLIPLPQIEIGPRECMYPRKCEKCGQRFDMREPAIKVEDRYWHNWKC